MRYRLPKRFVRRDANPLCIGQKQRWFLLQLLADSERVRLDTTAEPEFDRWRWVDYWRPVKEVIYFKRQVYVQALFELGAAGFSSGRAPTAARLVAAALAAGATPGGRQLAYGCEPGTLPPWPVFNFKCLVPGTNGRSKPRWGNARLVVTPAAPWQRLVLVLFALLFLGGAGFLLYELGRYQAGYSRLDAEC